MRICYLLVGVGWVLAQRCVVCCVVVYRDVADTKRDFALSRWRFWAPFDLEVSILNFPMLIRKIGEFPQRVPLFVFPVLFSACIIIYYYVN